MSRIGNKHISIPAGVTIEVANHVVTIKGPLGTLTQSYNPVINVVVENNEIAVTRLNEEKASKQLHGTTRAILAGMVKGVSEGFKTTLVINGVGYKASLKGSDLALNIGYSHVIEIKPLPGTKINVVSPVEIEVTGCNKQAVGQLAAVIRSQRAPEPYLGKGIAYKGEKIRRKEGKKAGKK